MLASTSVDNKREQELVIDSGDRGQLTQVEGNAGDQAGSAEQDQEERVDANIYDLQGLEQQLSADQEGQRALALIEEQVLRRGEDPSDQHIQDAGGAQRELRRGKGDFFSPKPDFDANATAMFSENDSLDSWRGATTTRGRQNYEEDPFSWRHLLKPGKLLFSYPPRGEATLQHLLDLERGILPSPHGDGRGVDFQRLEPKPFQESGKAGRDSNPLPSVAPQSTSMALAQLPQLKHAASMDTFWVPELQVKFLAEVDRVSQTHGGWEQVQNGHFFFPADVAKEAKNAFGGTPLDWIAFFQAKQRAGARVANDVDVDKALRPILAKFNLGASQDIDVLLIKTMAFVGALRIDIALGRVLFDQQGVSRKGKVPVRVYHAMHRLMPFVIQRLADRRMYGYDEESTCFPAALVALMQDVVENPMCIDLIGQAQRPGDGRTGFEARDLRLNSQGSKSCYRCGSQSHLMADCTLASTASRSGPSTDLRRLPALNRDSRTNREQQRDFGGRFNQGSTSERPNQVGRNDYRGGERLPQRSLAAQRSVTAQPVQQRRGDSAPNQANLLACFKCGQPGHFAKSCPVLATSRNRVPGQSSAPRDGYGQGSFWRIVGGSKGGITDFLNRSAETVGPNEAVLHVFNNNGVDLNCMALLDSGNTTGLNVMGSRLLLDLQSRGIKPKITLVECGTVSLSNGSTLSFDQHAEFFIEFDFQGRQKDVLVSFAIVDDSRHGEHDWVEPIICAQEMQKLGLALGWSKPPATVVEETDLIDLQEEEQVFVAGPLRTLLPTSGPNWYDDKGPSPVITGEISEPLPVSEPPKLGHPMDFDALEQANNFHFIKMRGDVLRNKDFDFLTRCKVTLILDRYKHVFSEALRPGDVAKGVAKAKDVASGATVAAKFFQPSARRKKEVDTWVQSQLDVGILSLAPAGANTAMASPMHLIGDTRKRLIVDNSRSGVTISKIPANGLQLEAVLASFLPAGFAFSTFDLCGAFHLFEYDEDSPIELRMVRNGWDVYVSNRLIMGSLNSTAHLGNALFSIFGRLEWLKIYADDICQQHMSEHALLDNLESFLTLCDKHGLILKASKAVVLAKSVTWVGHTLDKDGVRPSSNGAEDLANLTVPATGADLAAFIGLAQYFSSAIVNCSQLLRPLQDFAELVYDKADSRSSSKTKTVNLAKLGWNSSHTDCWRTVRERMINAIKLQHRDHAKVIHLFCDASSTGFGAVATQVRSTDMHLPVLRRRHEILACVSGRWDPCEAKRPTIQLEAAAIKKAILRLWHLLDDGTEIQIWTDHRNLCSVFDPDSTYVTGYQQPGQARLVRDAWLMSEVPHSINYIAGEENKIADLLSRLATCSTGVLTAHCDQVELEERWPGRLNSMVLQHAVRTNLDDDWEQPSIAELALIVSKGGDDAKEYERLAAETGAKLDTIVGVWRQPNGAVLVPNIGTIRLRLLAVAHCGAAGHRSAPYAIAGMAGIVAWPGMQSELHKFASSCIHCLAAKRNFEHVPFGKQVVASERNHTLSMDFVSMGESTEKNNKLLVIVDRFTGFTQLHPCRSENSEQVARALCDWFANFGVPKVLLTDAGTAFVNGILDECARIFHLDHHVITAHTHWPNGQAERKVGDVYSVFRVLRSEYQLPVDQWELLLPMVKSVINASPSRSNNGRSPLEAFTALPKATPFTTLLNQQSTWVMRDLSPALREELFTLVEHDASARDIALFEFQEQAVVQRQAKRMRERGVKPSRIVVGDFVMAKNWRATAKSDSRWLGPAQVLSAHEDNFVFTIQYFNADASLGKTDKVHVKHLRFFDNAVMVLTPELLKQSAFFRNKLWDIERLEDVYIATDGKWAFDVRWDDGDLTCEYFDAIKSSVPEMVFNFLNGGAPKSCKPRVKQCLEHERSITRGSVAGNAEPAVSVSQAPAPAARRAGRNTKGKHKSRAKDGE